jgi:hypothetical protein
MTLAAVRHSAVAEPQDKQSEYRRREAHGHHLQDPGRATPIRPPELPSCQPGGDEEDDHSRNRDRDRHKAHGSE